MEASEIKRIADAHYGFVVSDAWAERVAVVIAKRIKQFNGYQPSLAYIENWIHLAMEQDGLFETPLPKDNLHDVATARLHVFFIQLEETDEQLQRLAFEPERRKAKHATSKLSRTNLKAKPIDRLAWIVAPTDP